MLKTITLLPAAWRDLASYYQEGDPHRLRIDEMLRQAEQKKEVLAGNGSLEETPLAMLMTESNYERMFDTLKRCGLKSMTIDEFIEGMKGDSCGILGVLFREALMNEHNPIHLLEHFTSEMEDHAKTLASFGESVYEAIALVVASQLLKQARQIFQSEIPLNDGPSLYPLRN